MRHVLFMAALALLSSGCRAGEAPELERVAKRSLALAAAATITVEARAAEAAATAALSSAAAEQVITISAVGDCALGDLRRGGGAPGSFRYELRSQSDPMGYPFSEVRHIFAADDLTIANLEGPLTNHDGWTNDVFSIRGKPEYAAMLARGSVELVDIDNNHSHDYGPIGHEDTKRALEAAGVAYFGRGTVDRRRIKGMNVVNLGYLGGPDGTKKRMVADVRREAKPGTIVIVSFHWGVEGFYATHPGQRWLGKAAIDAGAELVLGHHPHVLQGIETYKQRHIVHSMGNFVFGANSQPRDVDSIVYQERFRVRDGRVIAVEQNVIPVAISGARSRNDFRPVVLTGEQGQRVLSKLDKLSAKLAGGTS